jgi:hypothetical protein
MFATTPLVVRGPWGSPRQLLGHQTVEGHSSVHDDATASSLGLTGAPIEGPTHFSQFDPLAFALWGRSWFETGCVSAHFQTMVVEGERVQAEITTLGPGRGRIDATKEGGDPVLTGTASVGDAGSDSEVEARLASGRAPEGLVILDRLEVGMTDETEPVTMSTTASNGGLYPFSLGQKLSVITENSPWYSEPTAVGSPWGRAIVPFEMIAVLALKTPHPFPVRQPSIGLFLDLEVRLLAGPVLVDEEYRVRRTVVGLSSSRRTESYWVRNDLVAAGSGEPVATVLLHHGVFRESYVPAG